ncbi:uncharacterized protein LOC122655170 [Telopea speciosissima]|uniref:uncharacterized protein LOC122655170 n=1 Tax=Telopea speciosissima TaxID=54955 RepID=UPI001CC80C85|nr:uncharacterized protein LOC122655170 [Telopea speciosissima]
MQPARIPSSLKAKVSDFLEDGNWVFPIAATPALNDVFTTIWALEITSSNREDCRFWAHTKSEVFTVRSAWDALRMTAPQPEWGWAVWQRSLQPRNSIFGWRLANGALPTDDKVKRKSVSFASRCELCAADCETKSHLFLECNFAIQVWKEILFIFNENWNGFPSIELLFSWWRRKSKVVSLPKEVSDGSNLEESKVKSVQELVLARRLRVSISKNLAKNIFEVRWKLPPPGWIKLNIDGSSLGNPASASAA